MNNVLYNVYFNYFMHQKWYSAVTPSSGDWQVSYWEYFYFYFRTGKDIWYRALYLLNNRLVDYWKSTDFIPNLSEVPTVPNLLYVSNTRQTLNNAQHDSETYNDSTMSKTFEKLLPYFWKGWGKSRKIYG